MLIDAGGQEYRVNYQPGESDCDMFGGNSNWRGPIWVAGQPANRPRPASVLHLLRKQLRRGVPYWFRPKAEPVPGGPGDHTAAVCDLPDDAEGRRPVSGDTQKFQKDPHWRDYLLFNEYFHGDNGSGRAREPPNRLEWGRRPPHAIVRDSQA